MVKVLLIIESGYWASNITVSNIIEHISPEFQCTKRHGLGYRPGDEVFDVVYVHCTYGVGREAINRYLAKNRVSRLCAGVRGWLGLQSTRHTLNLYDAVNASNKLLFQEVQKLHPHAFLCHAGVDTRLFKPFGISRAGQLFTVGWVGDPSKSVKNYDLLPSLGFRYLVATSKPYGHWIPHEQMPHFYNGIDVLVSLSSIEGRDAEGCPLAVLEAGACGKPVMATHTSGAAREYLTPWQVVKGNIRTVSGMTRMQRKLKALRDDPKLREDLGQRNRKAAVETWDWKIKVKQYELFFRGALA